MLSTSNPLLHSAILNLDVENCKDLLKDNKISDINEFAELIRDILITPKINEYRSSFDRAVQILDVFWTKVYLSMFTNYLRIFFIVC